MTEYVSVEFKPARDVLVEGHADTIPFVLSVEGRYSASPPIAFFFVIDTSYSMDGEKIFRAKQAALEILNLLREKDLVAVYSFDGKFHKILDPTPLTNRDLIEKAIVSLKLGPGTNLYEVFKRLAEEAEKITKQGTITVIRAIFLTDGTPTTGPKKPEKILEAVKKFKEAGGTALIIGVGEEYNENLLLRIANTLNSIFEHVSNPRRLREVIKEYVMVSKEVSAKKVTIVFRLKPGFVATIYNQKYYQVPGGIEIEIGDINYKEKIDVIGELTTPPLRRGEVEIGEIQVSYTNVSTNEREFTPSLKITFNVVSPEEARKLMIREEVLAEVQLIKTAKKLSTGLGKKYKKEDIEKELHRIIEATMRLGSEGLAAKTISIKERIEKEGLTPDISKEMASIISKIISGKVKEISSEEKEEG